MGPDRLHRLRRPAGAHRAPAPALRRGRGWIEAPSSRTRSPPATCCPGPPRPSSRSSAPGGSAGASAALVGGARLHRARAGHHPRPRGALPRRLAAALGRGAPAPAPAPPSRRSPSRPSLGLLPESRAPARGAALALARSTCSPERRPRRRSGRGSCSCCSVRGSSSSLLSGGPASRLARRRPRRGARRHRRDPGARLGRVQGRRALVRRRLRDHPADAGRRRQPLPLADARASS